MQPFIIHSCLSFNLSIGFINKKKLVDNSDIIVRSIRERLQDYEQSPPEHIWEVLEKIIQHPEEDTILSHNKCPNDSNK